MGSYLPQTQTDTKDKHQDQTHLALCWISLANDEKLTHGYHYQQDHKVQFYIRIYQSFSSNNWYLMQKKKGGLIVKNDSKLRNNELTIL